MLRMSASPPDKIAHTEQHRLVEHIDKQAVPPRPGEETGQGQGEEPVVPVVQAPASQHGPRQKEEEPGQQRKVVRAVEPRGQEAQGIEPAHGHRGHGGPPGGEAVEDGAGRQQDGGRAFLQGFPQKVVEHHGHAHEVQDAEMDDLSPYHGPQLHRDPRRQHDDAPAQVAAGEPGRGSGQEDEAAAGDLLHHVQGRGEELLPADDAEQGQIVEEMVDRHQRDGQGAPPVQNVKPAAHYTLKRKTINRNFIMSIQFRPFTLC